MDKVLEAVDSLIENGQLQARNIDALSDNMAILVQAVRMRPTKKQATKVIAGVVCFILALNLLMFGFVYKSAKDTRQTAHQISDCLNPQGDCYAKSQDLQQLNRRVISLRSEQLRLRDEIKVDLALSDSRQAEARTQTLHDIEEQLRGAGQQP